MWCLAGRYTIQSKLERKITEPFRQLPLLLTLYGPTSVTSLSLTALCSVVFALLALPLSRLLAYQVIVAELLEENADISQTESHP